MKKKDPQLPKHTGKVTGGMIAREKLLARDPNWYSIIGSKGGKAKRVRQGGFAAMTHEEVVELGRKGGAISKRRKRSDT